MGDLARAVDLGFDAVLFDMDGVVTRTARLHASVWKEVFDELLRERVAQGLSPFRPFDPHADYLAYVDGKPRHEGVRSFLAARGLQLREGEPTDEISAMTVRGLAACKDERFTRRMRREGVEVFASSIAIVCDLRARGVKTAVVTSSRNGREVLRAAAIEELFDVRVDGIDAGAIGLLGKPQPDVFAWTARCLDVMPARAVVIEDAVSGVEAARRGDFGLVVGVDRGGNRDALAAHGADLVVADLAELDVAKLDALIREKREATRAWRVEQEGLEPAREREMESIFTVGNGYLGVRGAPHAPLPGSEGDLFIAGVYDCKHPERPYSELEFMAGDRGDCPHSELVSVPFPFRWTLSVDGKPLLLEGPLLRRHRRALDLRRGILEESVEYETDVDRRIIVETRRCASLADLHLLLQEITVCLVNHSGMIELDGSIVDADLDASHPHLRSLDGVGAVAAGVEVRRFATRASGVEIGLAAHAMDDAERAAVRWRGPAPIGREVRFRRYIAVYTSADVVDPSTAAAAHVRALRWPDFESALAAHTARWGAVWERANVRVPGSPMTEQALRFNAYHLTSAADRDPRVSVGARAMTGRAYEGHVFWDVEIFSLPFYVHTHPEVARALLLYRHNTLAGARRRARELGWLGACYAWESTVTGDDVTPRAIRLKTTGEEIPIFTGTQQVHVTADVAHGVWRYWETTRDRDFMREAGVEILIETARFWMSRATRGSKFLHIRGVVGPDEYHHSVDDNAYTNWMARSNLERATQASAWMEREMPGAWGALAERLALARDEPLAWDGAARELFCPAPNARGLIEQFEGFFDLEDYPLQREERFKTPISRLFDWRRINELKLIKQADVVMLLHLFPEAFSPEVALANYRYYEPMTEHASSLSPGIHAAVAARLALREEAEQYWRESLWLDLSNRMGNSALGVHPACMGATWQAMVFGFLGVRFGDSGPSVDPDYARARLPSKWRGVALTLAWRGELYPIEVARAEEGEPG